MWKLKIGEGGPWLFSLNNHIGRQHWEFDPDAGTPDEREAIERLREEYKKNRFKVTNTADLIARTQLRKENPCGKLPPAVKVGENEELTEEAVTTTLRRAISSYSSLQVHDGHWPGEFGGPSYFLQPLVMIMYITGALHTVFTAEHVKEMKRYLYNHQNEDGGWGLHTDGISTMFGSALSYITLRLLGEGPDDGEDMAMTRARKWILDNGGAVGIPSWGKFYLTVLGVYEWSGCNPTPPEFWLFPKWFPVHPGKTMCYCRLVYVPMSYLYGKRFVGKINDLILSIRQEIYTIPYEEIDWNKARYNCAEVDLYYPRPLVQKIAWDALRYVAEPVLTRWPFSKLLREKAMQKAMEVVHFEDLNTRYYTIGCVEKVIAMLACWVEDPNSDSYKYHLARIPDYIWVAEDGLRMTSFGSQLWDTSFSLQAILASNLTQEYAPVIRKAYEYIKASQVLENPSGDFDLMFRHISKGSWPLSMRDHGWQVSDCTAEGLKTVMIMSQMPPELSGDKVEKERLFDAVNVMLSLQSKNGGFSAWEPQRAYRWLEKFNPMEFIEDVLIEREYVECTSSVIQAFMLFKKVYSEHRRKEIEVSISRAVRYIEDIQNPDGSWYGYWGVCFTYGTWFGVEALAAVGRSFSNCSRLRKACEFLLSKQLPDGGWGESYLSCHNKVYTHIESGQAHLVQTSWALLALIAAGQAEVDPEPICRGVKVLINAQMENGDFPQQQMTGVFMRSCMLNYANYRNIFPIFALGAYRRRLLCA